MKGMKTVDSRKSPWNRGGDADVPLTRQDKVARRLHDVLSLRWPRVTFRVLLRSAWAPVLVLASFVVLERKLQSLHDGSVGRIHELGDRLAVDTMFLHGSRSLLPVAGACAGLLWVGAVLLNLLWTNLSGGE